MILDILDAINRGEVEEQMFWDHLDLYRLCAKYKQKPAAKGGYHESKKD